MKHSYVACLYLAALLSGCAAVPGKTEQRNAGEGLARPTVSKTERRMGVTDLVRFLVFDEKARMAVRQARLQAKRAAGMYAQSQQRDIMAQRKEPSPETLQAREAAIQKRKESEAVLERGMAGFREFLDDFPDDAQVHYKFGTFCHDYGPWNLAITHFKVAIALDPTRDLAHHRLGLIHSHSGKDLEAVEEFKTAIQLKPDEPVYHNHLAVMYSTTRKRVAAHYGWNLAEVFHRALAEYRKASELAPEDFGYARDVAAHYKMARYYEVAPRPDEALAAWEYCLSLELNEAQESLVLTSMARLLINEKGDKNSARELLLRAKELDDTPTVRTLLKKCE